MTSPRDLTVTSASALLKTGKLSAVELLQSCFQAIDAHNDSIEAWALLDREGALRSAHRCDSEIKLGRWQGPLHGIPVGVKDIIFTKGMRTEAGSDTWAGFVPTFDATVVVKLKQAGAIVMGKTHTTEFAFMDPAPTRNPWNINATPGGSSSGSGAAVSARMCPVALGTQTGGSVLRPATYNGVVGFKPQHGRISTYGIVPISSVLDHVGAITRSVEDSALVLDALAGHDPLDPYSLTEPLADLTKKIHGMQHPPKLGLARTHFFEHTNNEVRAHTEDIVKRLTTAGAEVVDIILPESFGAIGELWATIAHTDCAAYHKDMFKAKRSQYSAGIRANIENGLQVTGIQYAESLRSRLILQNQTNSVVSQVDAIITPGATEAAPCDLSTTGNAAMQMPWTFLGYPSLSLPTGLNSGGMPLGIQLISAPRSEGKLLSVAEWCEQAVGQLLVPPLN